MRKFVISFDLADVERIMLGQNALDSEILDILQRDYAKSIPSNLRTTDFTLRISAMHCGIMDVEVTLV